MDKFLLFKELRKHRKLAEKRAVNYEQNKTAKVLVYVLSGFMIAYLMFFAVMLALIANSLDSMTSVEMIMAALPFIGSSVMAAPAVRVKLFCGGVKLR